MTRQRRATRKIRRGRELAAKRLGKIRDPRKSKQKRRSKAENPESGSVVDIFIEPRQ